MNVRGIYLCFMCLKEKKWNIRIFDFWITKYWYQSYKYQSIKIIYDQSASVSRYIFHCIHFVLFWCAVDFLYRNFSEFWLQSQLRNLHSAFVKKKKKAFQTQRFCTAWRSHLRWKSDDWDRNGQRYSHSEDHSSGVVKGGDGPRHVWHAHGDNKLEVEN